MTVDAHVHLWDRAADPQGWIDPVTMTAIDRDFGVADLVEMLAHSGVDRAVVVQSANDIGETARLLALDDARIAGVVGWIDVTGDVTGQLAELPAGPGRLVGVRHLAHVDPDPSWLVRSDVVAGLGAVSAAGLAIDLVLRSHQLRLADRVAGELDDARFVLDHVGGVAEADDVDGWERSFRRLARRSNVAVKVSGLWRLDDPRVVRRIIGLAIEEFGPDRLLYGSDWPLARLGGDVPRWRRTADAAIAHLPSEERGQILGATAERIYRLLPPA